MTKSSLYTHLIMQQAQPATGHPDFVLAMKYLFDRDTIRRALFRGYATIANDHPIQPNHPYFLAGLPQRAYDPERARFHLKRAGLLGIRLPMYASPAAEGSVDMAAMLQQSAAQAGIKLAVNRVPADGYWSNHWMKHPLDVRQHESPADGGPFVQHVFQERRALERVGLEESSGSTSCWWQPGPKATRRNGGRCTATCRSCCTSTGRRHPRIHRFHRRLRQPAQGL